MKTPRARIALMIAAPLMLAIAQPAAAGDSMYGSGPHTPNVGLHWILDGPDVDPEHPAVTCTYDGTSRKLARMLIRQPVILADVSGGPRTQRVGWRAIIQRADDPNGPWTAFRKTPVQKATASGRFPADLGPRTVRFPATVDQSEYYRVEYRLFWYRPNGKTVADRATHRPFFYGLKLLAARSYMSDLCESVMGFNTAGTHGKGPHSGKRGLHWILDHVGPYPEYPAVTCEYNAASRLVRMRIRRPVVFARNTGPGVQRADVAWKAIIQATYQNDTQESFTKIGETSTTRLSATDVEWADFLPKVFNVGGNVDAIGLRVLYRLTWFKGRTNTVQGRANHFPLWYKVKFSGPLSTWDDDYCYVSIAN